MDEKEETSITVSSFILFSSLRASVFSDIVKQKGSIYDRKNANR
jgi:hypothetical protein